MRFAILEWLNPATKKWEDWAQYETEVWGTFFIVKKDKSLNTRQCESLMGAIGWSGDLKDFDRADAQFFDCRVETEKNTWTNKDTGEEQTNFRVKWINPYHGNLGNLEEDDMKGLQALHGTALRALSGNVARNAPPPKKNEDGPAAPAPPDDDIPF